MTDLRTLPIRMPDDQDYLMKFEKIPYGFKGVVLFDYHINFTIIFTMDGFVISTTPNIHQTMQDKIASVLKPLHEGQPGTL